MKGRAVHPKGKRPTTPTLALRARTAATTTMSSSMMPPSRLTTMATMGLALEPVRLRLALISRLVARRLLAAMRRRGEVSTPAWPRMSQG